MNWTQREMTPRPGDHTGFATGQTFDPVAYWQAAGSDTSHPDHEQNFVHSPVFARQEERLLAFLETLTFDSILEAGCGWGRITKLVHDRWPDVPYAAFDLSPERAESTARRVPGVTTRASSIRSLNTPRKYDLVLCVETLMHIPPDEVAAAVAKLQRLSSGHVVTLDWSEPIKGPIAEWNWRHDYEALGLRKVETLGLQAIFVG